ncbi:MAG: hypothetical protein JJ954_13330 [Hyphomonas sp.]|uniref:hypothetical protein n=1 Tax=Hyphomonas sp. TaxID=87 RepID=UPI001AFE3641|nr:hypothetical protein [Hyphomonas sp.]MBO6583931.1 hypothetical protein [Hyphomonas sp.]
MEEYEAYILAAVLMAIDKRYVATSDDAVGVSIQDVDRIVRETYGIDFPSTILESVLISATDLAKGSGWLNHVSSPYTTDRFVVGLDGPDDRAEALDLEDVWENAVQLGISWLSEALRNIREDVLSAEDSAAQNEIIGSVPASDRYVRPSDNQPEFEELSDTLQDVRGEVQGSNSIPDEERAIALAEIALFEYAIGQPRLAHDIIERFLAFCMGKLTSWCGSAAVGVLIDRLKGLIESFINSVG